MAWLRKGDNTLLDPRFLELGTTELERVAAWGLLDQVASMVSAKKKDYRATEQMFALVCPTTWEPLVAALVKAGLLTRVARSKPRTWLIVADPDLLHMRSQEEVDRDRLRTRDRRSPDLVAPALLRDGDQCRWCGKTVHRNDHKSARGATWDHLAPWEPTRVETWVVACLECNQRRGKPDDDLAGMVLLPRPAEPYYSDPTRALLNKHYGEGSWPDPSAVPDPGPGVRASATRQPPAAGHRASRPDVDQQRPSGSSASTSGIADTAASDLRDPGDRTPRTGDPAAGGTTPEVEAATPEPGSNRDPVCDSRAGSGRSGSGGDGTGGAGSGGGSAPPPSRASPADPSSAGSRGRRRRGRRGGRSS